MDDKNAFERQIAAEIDYEAGPPHPVDALAITRTAKSPSPSWRIRSMLSPAKAVTAGALVFAIGGATLIAQPFRQASVTTPGADTGANALVLEDGTDDFHAEVDDGEGPAWVDTRGPADADLVNVTVSVDGDRLAVRFETAGAVPQVPDDHDPIMYLLLIDTDGDFEPEYQISSEYTDWGSEGLDDDAWSGLLWDLGPAEATDRLEAPQVVDGALTASVALDALPVAPAEMRFAALTTVYGGFDDTNNVFNWTPIDRVPDDESAWRTLSETDAVGATETVASPR